MYKKIVIFFLIIFSLNCFNLEKILFSQKEPSIDVELEGVWSVFDETKNISRLLYLKHDISCATLCVEFSIKNNKATIHCYNDEKIYQWTEPLKL